MHFVSSTIYQKAVRLALREGLLAEHLAHHQKVPALQPGAKYIPIDWLFDVYELADQYLKPGFGIRQGKQLSVDDYGTLGLSWKTCWRASEVLDRTERYMVLVTDHGKVSKEESGNRTQLRLIRDAHRKGVETANEATFVMLTRVMKKVTGKEIHPLKVHFKHKIKDESPFTDFFQCTVSFGQTKNFIQFATTAIDVTTIKADRAIHQFLVQRMDEEKKGIEVNADGLIKEVFRLVEERLPSGIPAMDQVATHLRMSSRTLKRRLAEKGLSYRGVVQKIQKELSGDLLENSTQSVGEIAFQTGFSDQTAFNRAFKRWTGQSPTSYRKNPN